MGGCVSGRGRDETDGGRRAREKERRRGEIKGEEEREWIRGGEGER